MSTILKATRGSSMSRPLQAYDQLGAAMIGIFSDTDALTGTIFTASGNRADALAVEPIVTWISAGQGTFLVSLSPTQTLALPAGSYWIEARATRGSDIAELLRAPLTIYDAATTYTPPAASSVTSQAVLSPLTTVYCTDEDIAIRASSDFQTLAIDSQRLAYGSDGAFDPLDPWTLTSASNNFAAQGVTTGNVCLLQYPKGFFGGVGNMLAVSAVHGDSLTLRRLGMAPNAGIAPSPSTGLVGVAFVIPTLGPQIELASWELNRRYQIDDKVPGRSANDIRYPRDLRQATVLWVIKQRLTASLTGQADSSWMKKLAQYQAELDDTMARLQLQWGAIDNVTNAQTLTTWMSTRIARG